MAYRNRLSQVAFPSALTLACLFGAAHLGMLGSVPAVSAEEVTPDVRLCANTECEGVSYCRYKPGIVCSFPSGEGGGWCQNNKCSG